MRLAIVILILLTAPTAYFLCIYGKNSVIAEMTAASRANDAAAFGDRVDWEAVRAFLKADIGRQKQVPHAGAVGPPAAKVGGIVDHYIRPENVPVLFHYHDNLFPGVREEDFILSSGFAFPFGFDVTLAYPASNPLNLGMPKLMHERLRARFVFGLDGLTWKIREMHVPLMMVPSQERALPRPGKGG